MSYLLGTIIGSFNIHPVFMTEIISISLVLSIDRYQHR
jgi:hypothetical protein